MSYPYIEVRHPAGDDANRIYGYNPARIHSTYYGVESYTIADGVLEMIHGSGKKSYVILGKGYSVMEKDDAPQTLR